MRIRRNVADWERALSMAAGVAIVISAARRRRLASARTVTGLALIGRAASGYCPVSEALGLGSHDDDTRVALGGSGGTRVEESITIARSPREIYDVWRDVEQLPRFMRGVARVERIDDRTSHWTLRAPGGMTLEWRAEIINDVEPSLIAWKSLAGADVVSAGSVRFKEVPRGGTEVTVTMQYDAPGGTLGRAVSWMTGRSAEGQLREDLRRLKRWLETGEQPTVEGQPAGPRSSAFTAAAQVVS